MLFDGVYVNVLEYDGTGGEGGEVVEEARV